VLVPITIVVYIVIQYKCLIFSEKFTTASFTNNVKNIEEVENPRISSVAT
jgi:hypothetical protein